MALSILALCATAAAQNQPLLQQAQDRYDQADFPGALHALDQAEQTAHLSREELVRLLELRGLVHLGMRDTNALHQDMVRLASVDPEHHFDETIPPELSEAFARAKGSLPGPIRLDAHVVPTASGVSVQAAVQDDPLSLVRQVRVNARQGEGTYQTGLGSVELATNGTGNVEYYAEAVGPGGAVLVSAGTASAPLVVPTGHPEHHGGIPWLWVGTGAAVAAVVIIGIIAASLGGSSSDTRLTSPTLPMRIPL